MMIVMTTVDDNDAPGPPPVLVLPDLPVPPEPDGEDGGDGDQGVHVHVSVTVFGKHRAVTLFFPDMPDEHALADELYAACSAVARLHGRGVWFEMERRCADSGAGG